MYLSMPIKLGTCKSSARGRRDGITPMTAKLNPSPKNYNKIS